MSFQQTSKNLKIEIDNFIFYQKSKVGLIVGRAVEPLISGGKTFVQVGEECRIKFKLDCNNLNLQQLAIAKIVDILVKNSCEEKFVRGVKVKQFSVESFNQYNADDQREIIQF